jgi:GAF domain-containing protein
MTDDVSSQPEDGAALRAITHGILQRSIELTGASFGNVQLVDWRAGELRIVAQQGFQSDFLRCFARVKYGDACACARVLASRATVVIRDVTEDAEFAPHREIAHRAGFRAVTSMPLLAGDALVGVVSTHFALAHSPTDHTLAALKEAARSAANAIITLRAHTVPFDEMVQRSRHLLRSSEALLGVMARGHR